MKTKFLNFSHISESLVLDEFIYIHGYPGAGKSSLVSALAAAIQQRNNHEGRKGYYAHPFLLDTDAIIWGSLFRSGFADQMKKKYGMFWKPANNPQCAEYCNEISSFALRFAIEQALLDHRFNRGIVLSNIHADSVRSKELLPRLRGCGGRIISFIKTPTVTYETQIERAKLRGKSDADIKKEVSLSRIKADFDGWRTMVDGVYDVAVLLDVPEGHMATAFGFELKDAVDPKISNDAGYWMWRQYFSYLTASPLLGDLIYSSLFDINRLSKYEATCPIDGDILLSYPENLFSKQPARI